ncbi:hypothetical protein GCM10009549_25850 [Streptomyces thermoalcalitolerans]|uniref:Uncharacterized protein n=1 Tax=Streptomyces thermoalcalitolerans TaxID=65605 RepID=A0ABP3Z1F7_9ACTN
MPGEPGERHPGQVGRHRPRRRGTVPLRGLLEPQRLQTRQPRGDALQERAARNAVLGREALGDGVREFVERLLLVVRTAPGLQDRRVVVGTAVRREEEGAELLVAERQMRVPQRLLEAVAVLDGVEGRIGPRGQPIAQQGTGAAVVHPGAAQRAEEPVDALRGQQGQPRGDQTALAPALLRGGVGGSLQQPTDDQDGVVVVDVEREDTRVEVAVVAQHVGVQEVEGEPLGVLVGVELALAGRGDRRVDEEQHVVDRDQIPERLHVPRVPRPFTSPAAPAGAGRGMGARTAKQCFRGMVRKSHRSPAAGTGTVTRSRSRIRTI